MSDLSRQPVRVSAEGVVWLSPDPAERGRVFDALYQQGMMIHVQFDARTAGVQVPPSLAARPVFAYYRDFDSPIRDLRVDADGIRAALSFSNEVHDTFVPWSAVLRMSAVDPAADVSRALHSVLRKRAIGTFVASLIAIFAARACQEAEQVGLGMTYGSVAAVAILCALYSAGSALLIGVTSRRKRSRAG